MLDAAVRSLETNAKRLWSDPKVSAATGKFGKANLRLNQTGGLLFPVIDFPCVMPL